MKRRLKISAGKNKRIKISNNTPAENVDKNGYFSYMKGATRNGSMSLNWE